MTPPKCEHMKQNTMNILDPMTSIRNIEHIIFSSQIDLLTTKNSMKYLYKFTPRTLE